MGNVIRKTRSVCPVCLKPVPAVIEEEGGIKVMKKTCDDCGSFVVPVWRNRIDYAGWIKGAKPLAEGKGLCCPKDCGICEEHERGTCCALLEVTMRCNLKCRFCFANGGRPEDDPSFEEMKSAIDDIFRLGNGPLLQFSGGEPSLRDDLPELTAYAKSIGYDYCQINTNGIRLAEDEDYVRRLKEAGMDIVYLQFDGLDDEIYKTLRGKALLEKKLKCIENCDKYRLGVCLVPTVVRGVNDKVLGDIARFAAKNVRAVKGVHYQPVSYFGRVPNNPKEDDRYTLDELIADLCDQLSLKPSDFIPSRCDHPLCGFHAAFNVSDDGTLTPVVKNDKLLGTEATAKDNREYVARHWIRKDDPSGEKAPEDSFEEFLQRMRTKTMTLSSMDFQDAGNIDIERLHRCSLHVYEDGKLKPFCARYITPQK